MLYLILNYFLRTAVWLFISFLYIVYWSIEMAIIGSIFNSIWWSHILDFCVSDLRKCFVQDPTPTLVTKHASRHVSFILSQLPRKFPSPRTKFQFLCSPLGPITPDSLILYLHWTVPGIKNSLIYTYSFRSYMHYLLWRWVLNLTTVMRRLTTGISSEKYVVRRFRRCANVIECNINIKWTNTMQLVSDFLLHFLTTLHVSDASCVHHHDYNNCICSLWHEF